MLRILKERLLRLGRDDDGVALVVTLAVFFFLYLVCAGVFAIGNAVKERIHLQNAVDAAAYSAAVVQADTISRVATINRAMSWTYAQMTKRQMDYIVCKWLKHTTKHYYEDRAAAQQLGSAGAHRHPYWFIGINPVAASIPPAPYRTPTGFSGIPFGRFGDENRVHLNRRDTTVSDSRNRTGIIERCDDFEHSHLRQERGSLYASRINFAGSLEQLREQVDEDRKTIRAMNDALERLTDARLAQRIETTARDILRANVPAYMANQCDFLVDASKNPRLDYMRVMTGNEEAQFLAWGHRDTIRRRVSDATPVPDALFETGSRNWFALKSPDSPGIQRSYHKEHERENSLNTLVTDWCWWTVRWNCVWTDPVSVGMRTIPGYWTCTWTPAGACQHGGKCDTCNGASPCDKCSSTQLGHLRLHRARLQASHLEDQYYNNGLRTCARAMPLMLTDDYFGRDGTITVGLVRRNGNPWGMVLGRVVGGLYSAFNPFNDTWCFASAKAGYKLYKEQEGLVQDEVQGDEERVYNGEARAFAGVRDYCIDWKEPIYTRTSEIVQRTYVIWIKIKIDDREIRVPRYVVRDVWEKAIYVNGVGVVWVELTDRPVYDKDGNFVGWDVDYLPNKRGFRKKRYEIANVWRQSWNLTQSDWDAVMIPVRQAGSDAREVDNREMRRSRYGSHQAWMDEVARLEAERGWVHDENRRNVAYRYEPTWGAPNAEIVRELVYNPSWKQLTSSVRTPLTTDVFAGGRHDPDPNGRWGRRLVEESASWRGWWDMPSEVDRRNGTFGCRWRIENPGNRLDWRQITDMMYH